MSRTRHGTTFFKRVGAYESFATKDHIFIRVCICKRYYLCLMYLHYLKALIVLGIVRVDVKRNIILNFRPMLAWNLNVVTSIGGHCFIFNITFRLLCLKGKHGNLLLRHRCLSVRPSPGYTSRIVIARQLIFSQMMNFCWRYSKNKD